MDLFRPQLSLLVGYGNPHSAAVPRTLAGGRRDKSLISSSTRGNCPLGTTFTKSSEPILLFFVGFLGAGTRHVDSATHENLIYYTRALGCATAQLAIHVFFPAVDAKSFHKWHLTFWWVFRGILLDYSIHCVSTENFYFETVPALTAFLPPEAVSSQLQACPVVAQPCPERTTITG